MKKIRILLSLLALPLLSGCIRNNGLCYTHIDENGDGICDVCSAEIVCTHVDANEDGLCDLCHAHMPTPPGPVNPCAEHTDHDLDGKCDVCGADMSAPTHTHIDANPEDGKCDVCGATMEKCSDHKDYNHDGYCDYCGTQMEIPLGKVTVYLVLSSVGRYNGQMGVSVPELNIENAIKLEGNVGDPLPTKEQVSHVYGSAELKSWYCYEGKGAPTEYTTIPNENNKILYANFVSNGQNPGPGPTPTPDPEYDDYITYYLNTSFKGETWDKDGALMFVWVWKGEEEGRAYIMSKVSDNSYSVNIPTELGYQYIIFVRASGESTTFAWANKWNQSQNMEFVSGKTSAQVTDWNHAEWN